MPAAPLASTVDPVRVVIATIVVPQSVDRPQLLVHTSDGRVELIEQQRWAEPLKRAIPRVIATQLTAELGDAIVWSSPGAAPSRPDVRLTLEVTRFESVIGTEAVVEIVWLARAGNDERSGRTLARTPVAAAGYDALLAAHRECLQIVSRDLAAAVTSLRGRSDASAVPAMDRRREGAAR